MNPEPRPPNAQYPGRAFDLAMRWHFPGDSKWLERALKVLLVLSASFLAICSLFAYLMWRAFAPHTAFISESPDGLSYVRVTEAWTVSDSQIRVFLSGAGWQSQIADKQDCALNFGHVAWSPDSKRLAIFCRLSYCGDLKMGWDVEAGQPIPFEEIAPLLREDIVKSYSLLASDLAPYGGDPIEWGSYYGDGRSSPGVAAFRERHKRSWWWLKLLPW